MPVSHKYNAIFIHIPKTGGSSIAKSMGLYGNKSIRSAWGNRRQHFTMSELLQEGCITEEEKEQYFKFSFVRNPFDRMVSLYLYQNRGVKKPNFPKYIYSTFKRIKNCTEKRLFYFRKQSDYLFYNEVCVVDFIGRFESIKTDFKKISNRLNIIFKLPHLKKSKRKHYRTYYDIGSRKIVKQFYEADLEKFGYSY